jgi:hypothetical protein
MDQGTVRISTAMLNCLKQVLYSQTNGVDLSPIVEDLGGDDTMAIAVALAYKGIKPEIDTTTRFDYYCNSYEQYEFVSYSLIKNMVTAKRCVYTFNQNTVQWETKQLNDTCFNLDRWLVMSTSEETCRHRVKQYIRNKTTSKSDGVGEASKTVLRVSPKE